MVNMLIEVLICVSFASKIRLRLSAIFDKDAEPNDSDAVFAITP